MPSYPASAAVAGESAVNVDHRASELESATLRTFSVGTEIDDRGQGGAWARDRLAAHPLRERGVDAIDRPSHGARGASPARGQFDADAAAAKQARNNEAAASRRR
jgi:hypothetical protein